MRPSSLTITNANSPFYFPVDWTQGSHGITVTPNSATVTVSFTRESPLNYKFSEVSTWTDVPSLTNVIASKSVTIGNAACLKIVVTGTSAQVDIISLDQIMSESSTAGLTTSADQILYTTAPDTYAATTLTAFGRTIAAAADSAAGRTALSVFSTAQVSASFLNKSGGTMTGNIDLAANKITSSATPSTGNDLTNKTYVDATFQPLSTPLSSIANLTTVADRVPYTTAANTYAVATLTSFGRTLIGNSSAAGARGSLSAQQSSTALTSISGLTTAADKMIYTTAADTYTTTDLTSFARTLLDDTDATAARVTLGAAAAASLSNYLPLAGGTLSAPLTLSAGSVSAPSLTFAGSTSTGLFAVATNTLAFSLNNGEAARFTPSRSLLIGTTSESSAAIVKIDSTTKGMLIPRGTTAQRNAIASPPDGLMFYDTQIHQLYIFNATIWQGVLMT